MPCPRVHDLRQAHPRSRGENDEAVRLGPGALGSSPLTRGKHRNRVAQGQARRLIPAHAGKTPRRRAPCRTRGAHPRSRGENPTEARPSTNASGSSPLTRGKLRHPPGPATPDGLIPAHAGKTILLTMLWSQSRGSSPLTRGKLRAGRGKTKAVGLIPAHAGKTTCLSRSTTPRRAHPRSRGENAAVTAMAGALVGSSPLTRGKLETFCDHSTTGRLIPAHAGKTPGRARCRSRRWAHPRSRGENAWGVPPVRSYPGSSPLTRGKPRPP